MYPRSHRQICEALMPTLRASCICVRPERFRSFARSFKLFLHKRRGEEIFRAVQSLNSNFCFDSQR
jgi:hypothetical protein